MKNGRKKMKIGIYGGSFNPVHNSQVSVVDLVLKENLVDEVWLMPCRNHPFNKNLVSEEHRIKMLELTFVNFNKVKINYTEINSDKISYTANTIKKLKKKYSHDFYFIAGTDAINDIDNWYDSAYLKNSLNFIGIQRQGHYLTINDLNLEKIINADLPLSSTEIRKKINEGKPITGLVDSKVEEYILDNQLYFSKFENPASTVDLIVPSNGKILLIKRKKEPYKDC